jgi:hypothetical protein
MCSRHVITVAWLNTLHHSTRAVNCWSHVCQTHMYSVHSSSSAMLHQCSLC